MTAAGAAVTAPLTERLAARAADLPDDGGYNHETRLLLLEAKTMAMLPAKENT